MLAHPEHTYQILTKRPRAMKNYLAKMKVKCPPNWWFGVSVESERYLWRIFELRSIPQITTRFVSIEPLLERIDPRELAKAIGPHYQYPGSEINWTITGGESDFHNPRPCDLDWLRIIRDVCVELGIPFYLKQLGGKTKCTCHGSWGCAELDGRTWKEYPRIRGETQ